MHSSILFYLVSGAALAAATEFPDPNYPTPACQGKGPYYKCFNNRFHGDCSVDPCAMEWCPDYVPKSCTPVSSSSTSISSTGIPKYSTARTSTIATTTSTTASYSTTTHAHWTSTSITSSRPYSNSTSTRFYGNSTTTRHHHQTSSAADDCSETSYSKPTSTKHWTDVTKTETKPPVTYTSTSTKGYTTSGSPPYVTPSHSHPHSSVSPSPSPSPCPGCDNKCPPAVLPGCLQPAGNYNYYMCVGNGFKGHCTSDPCGKAWCPDFQQGTCEPPRPADHKQHQCAVSTVTMTVTATPSSTYPATAKRDDTVCPAGTGYFQSCSNGFRGCCKSDACGSPTGWCAEYKPGTFQPVSSGFTTSARGPAPTEQPDHSSHGGNGGSSSSGSGWSDPTVCAPGTGYFQSCGNGFRGCCKSDACTLGYCPSN